MAINSGRWVRIFAANSGRKKGCLQVLGIMFTDRFSDSQKIQIAENFAKLHPTPCAAWTPDKEYPSDDDRYLAVYDNFIMGVYGDCYGINAEYDEDDNLIQEATEFEVAVEEFESKARQAEVFFFEITSELTGRSKFIEEHGRHGDW